MRHHFEYRSTLSGLKVRRPWTPLINRIAFTSRHVNYAMSLPHGYEDRERQQSVVIDAIRVQLRNRVAANDMTDRNRLNYYDK